MRHVTRSFLLSFSVCMCSSALCLAAERQSCEQLQNTQEQEDFLASVVAQTVAAQVQQEGAQQVGGLLQVVIDRTAELTAKPKLNLDAKSRSISTPLEIIAVDLASLRSLTTQGVQLEDIRADFLAIMEGLVIPADLNLRINSRFGTGNQAFLEFSVLQNLDSLSRCTLANLFATHPTLVAKLMRYLHKYSLTKYLAISVKQGGGADSLVVTEEQIRNLPLFSRGVSRDQYTPPYESPLRYLSVPHSNGCYCPGE